MNRFITAIQELAKRKPKPSRFNSAQWQQVAPAIRQKSFFSATVTSARVLTRWREMLLDWLSGATEEIVMPDGSTTTAFKEVSLAKFRERAAIFAIQEGLATEDDFPDESISNVISNARLQLVFNTNTEQAQEFAYWKERVGNEDYINRFPAARYVRRPGGNPLYFRPIHVAAEGTVKRWDDFQFWLSMNDESIGGFGVPWGPWGFNSYMRQQPVGRREAERLGLVKKGERLKVPNVNAYGVNIADQFVGKYKDPMKDVPKSIKDKAKDRLTDRLGPQVLTGNGTPSMQRLRDARALVRQKYGAPR